MGNYRSGYERKRAKTGQRMSDWEDDEKFDVKISVIITTVVTNNKTQKKRN